MTEGWLRFLNGWIEEQRHVAFELPVTYKADGSKNIASCRAVLTGHVEPIFRDAGVCYLFGTRLTDDSFRGKGMAIQSGIRYLRRRKVMNYEPGLLSRFVEFFSNETEDGRMLIDQRGTVAFVVPAASPVLASLVSSLDQPTVVRNYPTSMDRAGLKFARNFTAADSSKAVVCLPGRFGLGFLYVFAVPSRLRGLLGLSGPDKRNYE